MDHQRTPSFLCRLCLVCLGRTTKHTSLASLLSKFLCIVIGGEQETSGGRNKQAIEFPDASHTSVPGLTLVGTEKVGKGDAKVSGFAREFMMDGWWRL